MSVLFVFSHKLFAFLLFSIPFGAQYFESIIQSIKCLFDRFLHLDVHLII